MHISKKSSTFVADFKNIDMDAFEVVVNYLEQLVTRTNAGKGEVKFSRQDGSQVIITYLPAIKKGGHND